MISSSILGTMREMLTGSIEDSEEFDPQIIVHINMVLSVLTQLGVGPDEGFAVSSSTETWEDFIGSDLNKYNMVKTYMYLRIRLAFDPPQNSFIVKSFEDQCKELEWRLNVVHV